jgi:hypothetical protein
MEMSCLENHLYLSSTLLEVSPSKRKVNFDINIIKVSFLEMIP